MVVTAVDTILHMEIKKKKGSFNDYDLSMSFGELEAIRDALASRHTGPIADELYAGIVWSMERLPKPGEEDEDVKKGEEDGIDLESGAEPTPARPGAPRSRGGASGEINSIEDLDRELPAPKEPGEDEGAGEGDEDSEDENSRAMGKPSRE